MAEPFVGEIRLFTFDYPPEGWATCDGQLLPINQYQALFSLLGTTYGGDGRSTFALPDLRGRVPVHFGSIVRLGSAGGVERAPLSTHEMPGHAHGFTASSAQADNPSPVGMVWANQALKPYGKTPETLMSANALANAGAGQPHENRQPYLVTSFCIALQGNYPPRS